MLSYNMINTRSTPIVLSSSQRNRRARFLLFVKIIFKSLEDSGDKRLHLQAKALISDIRRRNRMGDPTCFSFVDAVELRLRELVGSSYWRRAQAYMHYYIIRKGNPVLPGNDRHRKVIPHAA